MSEIRDDNGLTEEEFLKAYRPGDYEKPSVAVDMVIFTAGELQENNYRKLPGKDLQILLIRRSGHPCLGKWALPGGFVEPEETTEQAARRELMEETGVGNIYLEQLYTFSEPHRDPRTWVMSCSYMALADKSRLDVHAGDDAGEAGWFSVHLETVSCEKTDTDDGGIEETIMLKLTLISENETLSAELLKIIRRSPAGIENQVTITSCDGIAFDHARIITYACERLRGKVQYTDIALNLMPEYFTLTQLQQIYEIILDKPLIKAPFRRKYGILAKPTEMLTSDAGHRPSRLYTRNWMTE